MPTTIGQILVNSVLPEMFRDYNRALGADELEDLLKRIIKEDPDSYREVSAKLMRLGARAAYDTGTTLKLSDLEAPFDNTEMYRRLDQVEDAIQNDKTLTPAQKREKLADIYDQIYTETKKKAYTVADSKGNGFAMQVKSKARGNQDQLSAMINTPGIYKDPKGNTVPMFIRHSYAEGLSPAEYWAGSYGARTGVVSTKFATANAGALGKLFSSASIEQVVTEDDCNTIAGMPVKTDDKDNIGCVLASDIGGYKAGTVITKSVVSDLQKQKVEDILVRSPITCGAKNGVCSHCAGIRENGKFPEIGYNLGLNAASALAERVAQGSLNCLAEGTLVRMADGSTKPIEKVEPGELVLGSDLNGNVSPTRVVARYDNGIQPCISTRFIENGTHRSNNPGIVLESTAIHPILGTQVVTGQLEEKLNWVPRMLEVGCESPEFYAYIVYFHNNMNTPEVEQHRLSKMLAEYIPESEKCSLIAFKRVEQKDIGLRHVYDLEVECKDHIYLLANGLIVHNTKHSGKKLEGVHGSYSGFDMLKSMATVPKVYKDKATVSEIDGTVEKIEKAPQGGSYVWVNDQKFYVPHGYDILVKQGDTVEAGDQLSDGVINPADAVRLKGIGEGRRYFTQRFTKAYRDSGYKGSRRNVEALSKSLIDNVVVDDTDAEGQMLPGDLVSYSRWSWGYKPRPNSVQDAPNKALGKYLEQPALHYSIGTRVTKKVIDELNKFKVSTVLYNENPPGVHPDMRSIVETTGQTDDWMGRLGTTYIGKRLIEDVQQGAESNSKGLNPYPAVAKGTTLGQWGTPGHQNEEFHY